MNPRTGDGTPRMVVRTADGLIGEGEYLEHDEGCILVSLPDGRRLSVSPDLLAKQSDGSYLLRLSANQIAGIGQEEYAVIPVMREEVDVQKRTVDTSHGVRIHKRVRQREQRIIQLLYRDELSVQHVPKNQFVDEVPQVRYEGTTMVVPLCEEVLVVQKRVLLKEELHVARRARHVQHAETVVLRDEHAVVERFGDPTPDSVSGEVPSTARGPH